MPTFELGAFPDTDWSLGGDILPLKSKWVVRVNFKDIGTPFSRNPVIPLANNKKKMIATFTFSFPLLPKFTPKRVTYITT